MSKNIHQNYILTIHFKFLTPSLNINSQWWKRKERRKRKYTAKTEYVDTPSPTTLWQSVFTMVKSSPFLLWLAWPWIISGLSIFSLANSRFSSTESGTVWWLSLLLDIVHTPKHLKSSTTQPLFQTLILHARFSNRILQNKQSQHAGTSTKRTVSSSPNLIYSLIPTHKKSSISEARTAITTTKLQRSSKETALTKMNKTVFIIRENAQP